MRIGYLYYFLDVAKTLSISKSATNHYISQQGLSRAIRSLEEEFDIILLERKGNTIKLTMAGEDFVRYAQRTIDAYELLKQQMQKYNKNKNKLRKHSLIMRATPFIFNYLFPLLREPLFVQFSDVGITAIELDIYRIISEISVEHTENTMYLISIPSNLQEILMETVMSNNLRFIPLLKTPLLATVSKTSPYAFKKELTSKDLQGLSIACQNDTILMKCITPAINPDNITFTSNNLALLNEQIINNNAVGFIPAFNSVNLPAEIVAIPFENSYNIEIGFLRNMKADLEPANLRIAEYIKNYCVKNLSRYSVYNEGDHSEPFR
jgi:DNA-binding transcriptional LysR family regulator